MSAKRAQVIVDIILLKKAKEVQTIIQWFGGGLKSSVQGQSQQSMFIATTDIVTLFISVLVRRNAPPP